ncbi:uncharacterized protein LOC128555912 [Mercenaria mercenaria]|uniref:uncharacterized protein LOC128555912 n=1 Tax=Mercenaria mercenaria TaxID=6596 RepID=UPI00234F05AC|nr:uncharacterized protein LOC128555912 [Mercenaria mercenaria]
MASVIHLKGVRTRFRNVLKKNIEAAKELLKCDVEFCDIDRNISETNKCMQSLKVYCEKLELQSEKLSGAVEETDTEFVQQITDEDSELCTDAVECCIILQQHKELLLSEKEKSETKQVKNVTIEETQNEQLVSLQRDMQRLMEIQLQQQEKLIESQTNKGKVSSTKLPKLDLISFSGDKTKWIEFWDSFKCSVHENATLSNSEKFNYLRSKVYGEAQRAISGLTLSDANYEVAVGVLKERFGNEQEVVDVHYNKLINLQPAINKTSSLRVLLDAVEKHLRSLEVLGQNANQDVFVSMIRAKLPEDVLVQLEILSGTKKKWNTFRLRDRLREYIIARERAEKDKEPDKRSLNSHSVQKGIRLNESKEPITRSFANSGSAHVLAAVRKQPTMKRNTENYADKCRYCQQKHWSDECNKYRTISERKQQLKDSCYKCLKTGHQSNECKRNKLCTHCGEVNKHHRSLCPKKFKFRETMSHLASEVMEAMDVSEENVLVSSDEMVLMQTALTDIKNPETSETQSVRLLLDSGSHRTYITEKLANRLHLKETGEQEIKLVTFGSNSTQRIRTKCANIDVKLKNGTYISVSVNIVPTISGHLHRSPVSILETEQFKHVVGSVDLADTLPTENESSSIEMLVGNDYNLDFILCQRIELHPGLYLLGSKLGWILTGRTNDQDNNDGPCMLIMTHGKSFTKTSFTNVDSVVPVKPDLEDFWRVESIGILDKQNTSDDEMAMKMFLDSLQFENGRYQVTWPWNEDCPNLPVNRELALGRLKSCLNKMKNKPDLLQKYDAVMKDQLSKGVIEKVEQSKTDGLVHYLPHHAVITPQKATTKIRVVYDASARTRKENKSLNECMYRGPVMLQDLCGMLLRFRIQHVAVVTDIEKAFLQIGLQSNQRDVTRFLWLKDFEKPIFDADNIQEYRFCRVPFGVISSPFLLGAIVDYHLKSYNDEIAEKLRNNIYVDNVISGAENTSEAIKLYKTSKSMFADASMNLREWITNSEVVNEFIPKEDRAFTNSVKVLGHCWNVKEDTINLSKPKVVLDQQEWTKRSVLKCVASVFDPLGLLSPVLLRGKVLLQSLWQKNHDWDEEISTEDQMKMSEIVSDINKINTFHIPRKVCEFHGTVTYSLLCFCDASEKAYSTVIYLHTHQAQTSIVNMVFSKTRLAPVKKLTIPRLELLAVVIGLRCLKFIRDEIRVPVSQNYLWTDSKCVLQWITSQNKLSVFVKNRVTEIKEHSNVNLSYIPTKENPADVASRGTTLEKLKSNTTWWYGPKWLLEPMPDWPVYSDQQSGITEEEIEEVLQTEEKSNKETMLVQLTNFDNTERASNPPFNIDSNKYSSVTRLTRVTALVLRFVLKLKKVSCKDGPLESTELFEAEKMWLQHVQESHFQSEIDAIRAKTTTSRQQQLGLFLDEQGLMRCKGRLENANLSEGARHPILLPKNDHLTELIIERTHKELLHSGISQTLAKTRQKFWIIHGRATVKTVLNKCVLCRRHEGGSYKMPPMSALPSSRVTESTPFSRTGLDYFGPIYLKTSGEEKKVWICLYTCLVTRAIHLELVSDMSTEEFLLCLKRFIAQKGTPVEITSDNAKQFKAASSILDQIWHGVLHSNEVQSYVANANIKWNFIVELAPWMGGFYERLVGLVKRSFRKAIGRKLLTLIQIQTLIKEVEAVVNSRPLIYVGDDIHSTIALTPSHFLTLNPNIGIPQISEESDSEYLPYESSTNRLLNIWKKGQRILNKFWQIWRDEYLLSLRERMQTRLKTNRIQSSVKPTVGDVVIVQDNCSRGSWKLAKIEELIKSRDGEIRACKIQLSSGNILNRPLNLLFPVETSHSTVNTQNDIIEKLPQCKLQSKVNDKDQGLSQRPMRASASKALKTIKQQLSQ